MPEVMKQWYRELSRSDRDQVEAWALRSSDAKLRQDFNEIEDEP